MVLPKENYYENEKKEDEQPRRLPEEFRAAGNNQADKNRNENSLIKDK